MAIDSYPLKCRVCSDTGLKWGPHPAGDFDFVETVCESCPHDGRPDRLVKEKPDGQTDAQAGSAAVKEEDA